MEMYIKNKNRERKYMVWKIIVNLEKKVKNWTCTNSHKFLQIQAEGRSSWQKGRVVSHGSNISDHILDRTFFNLRNNNTVDNIPNYSHGRVSNPYCHIPVKCQMLALRNYFVFIQKQNTKYPGGKVDFSNLPLAFISFNLLLLRLQCPVLVISFTFLVIQNGFPLLSLLLLSSPVKV